MKKNLSGNKWLDKIAALGEGPPSPPVYEEISLLIFWERAIQKKAIEMAYLP